MLWREHFRTKSEEDLHMGGPGREVFVQKPENVIVLARHQSTAPQEACVVVHEVGSETFETASCCCSLSHSA